MENISNSKNKNRFSEVIIIFMLLIMYRILLDYSYKKIVYDLYAYSGFDYEFDLVKYIESWIYMVALFFFTPRNEKRVSNVFLNIQLVIMIIPMLSIYSFMNFSRLFLVSICICHILQCFILIKKSKAIGFHITGGSCITKFLFPVLLILLVIFSVRSNGMPSLRAFNINNVYDIRAKTVLPFGFGYFLNWACKIIIPFCIVYYYRKGKNKMYLFYILIQVIMYLIYAHKTFLFIIPVLLVIIFMIERNILIKGIYVGLIGGILSGLGLFILNAKNIFFASIFIRRFLFVPAFLKNMYYNFYSMGPKNWFAYGRLGEILGVKPNYPYTTSTVIATYIHGEFWTGANTGYMGDAYAQGGILMMFVMAILLALILRLIEKISFNMDYKLVIASVFYVLLTLNDGGLLTSLLTGGLAVFILIIYIYDSDEYHNKNKHIINKLR